MDWSRWIILVFGGTYAVVAPFAVVRAIRRREWLRLFELVVTMLFTSGFVLTILSPAVIQNAWAAWPTLRWLSPISAVLMLVNFLGIFRWLFSRYYRTQKI